MNYQIFETQDGKTANINLDNVIEIVDTPPLVTFATRGAEYLIRIKFAQLNEVLPPSFLLLTDRDGTQHFVNFQHVDGYLPESEAFVSRTTNGPATVRTVVTTPLHSLYILETAQQIRAKLDKLCKQGLGGTLEQRGFADLQPIGPGPS